MEFLQYARGGMHKDNEISAQPKDTYRDAQNGYLFSGDGDFFSFTTAKGNKLSFEVPISSYVGQNIFPDALLKRIVIGWVEGTDGLFLFTTTNEGTGGFGEILKVTFNEESSVGTISVVYQNGLFNFTTKHPIGNEAIYIEESDSIGRLYWTDNYNPPRSINVFNPPDPTLPQLIGTLNLTPQMYGAETHFRGTIRNQSGGDISGSLNCGMYRYTYRLLIPSDGSVSNWTPLTNPIFIGPKTTGLIGNYSSFSYYIKYEGAPSTTGTTKGIQMRLTDLDIRFTEIEIGAFYYNGTDSNPNGTIIKRGGISSTSFPFTHTGEENLGTITPGEIEISTASIEKVKTIATNKNRLMLGNITEGAELKLKPITDNISSETFTYSYLSDETNFPSINPSVNVASTLSPPGNSGLTTTPSGLFGHPATQGFGVDSGLIRVGQCTSSKSIYKSKKI